MDTRGAGGRGVVLMILSTLLLAGAASALPARAASTSTWKVSESSHFVVRHEAAMLPPGFLLDLERIHSRLRLDLAAFAPWLSKERIHLALYAGQDSYLRGEYHPPAWSNGFALPSDRLVVVYDQSSKRKLLEVIAHETTHLIFEGYWAPDSPPPWLNEGLAMMEEGDDPRTPEKSDWFQTMALLPARLQPIPIPQLAVIDPKALPNKDMVNLWYVQSFSLVHFLYREHSRLQFQNFAGRLHGGEPLDRALWEVYRYRTVTDLEASWKAWLSQPETQERERRYLKLSRFQQGEEAAAGPAAHGRLQPVGFSDFDFHGVEGR